MIEERAPAKVNLALHVTGRLPDGRHSLDSLVCFAATGDALGAEAADRLSLEIGGPEAAGVPVEGNLVLRAARLLDPARGARIRLHKALPAASGIGGGSSDAAAALRLLSRLWRVPLPPLPRIETLGSDVPVCLRPRAVRMRGAGGRLDPADLPPFALLLANPRVEVPTGAVFTALESRENPPLDELPPPELGALCDWLGRQRNDLAAPAVAAAPAIAEVLGALARLDGVRAHGMSGSGATCWAILETLDEARAAREALSGDRPEWWTAAAWAAHATRATT